LGHHAINAEEADRANNRIFDEHLVGIWPIKFTANPDDTAGERQAALDCKAHGDRGTATLIDPCLDFQPHLDGFFQNVSRETFLPDFGG
jgi:hypothetical protein